MNFDYTDEQRMIQDSAQSFVAAELHNERDLRASPSDRGCWHKLAEAGFLSLGLPEEYGGFGGAAEISLVCEAFGAGSMREPYLASALFAAQTIAFGAPAPLKAQLLPAMVRGEMIATVAYLEPQKQISLTSAKKTADAYVLNGCKTLVLAAPMADVLIVLAKVDGDGPSANDALFVVKTAQPGVSIKALPMADGGWCGEVVLADVHVPLDHRFGGSADAALNHGLKYAILGSSSEAMGVCSAALQLSIDHIQARQQFGVALATFQTLRHKVADMVIDCEMGRSALFKLLALFQAPDQHDGSQVVAMVKASLDDAAYRICAQAIQLHGAMGITEECAAGRYFARAMVMRTLFGATAAHLRNYTYAIFNSTPASTMVKI